MDRGFFEVYLRPYIVDAEKGDIEKIKSFDPETEQKVHVSMSIDQFIRLYNRACSDAIDGYKNALTEEGVELSETKPFFRGYKLPNA